MTSKVFLSVDGIKSAVDKSCSVYQHNKNYKVIKDNLGQYLIECQSNGSVIGLTHRDNVTLNGKLNDFFAFEDYKEL